MIWPLIFNSFFVKSVEVLSQSSAFKHYQVLFVKSCDWLKIKNRPAYTYHLLL